MNKGKGFFKFYEELDEDYLHIKKEINSLKIFGNIKQAFEELNNLDFLKVSYFLTKECFKCCLFGTTNLKKLNVIIDFEDRDLIYIDSVENLFNEKLNYANTHGPKCDYDKNGNILKTKGLIKFISNIKLPDLLFVNFHSNIYEDLLDLIIKKKFLDQNLNYMIIVII